MTEQDLVKILYALLKAYSEQEAEELFKKIVKSII